MLFETVLLTVIIFQVLTFKCSFFTVFQNNYLLSLRLLLSICSIKMFFFLNKIYLNFLKALYYLDY
jgi:hypothetical protein